MFPLILLFSASLLRADGLDDLRLQRCKAGDATSCFDAGEAAMRRGDAEAAVKLLGPICARGHLGSCVSLGAAESALGNAAASLKAQRKACDGGLALGCHNLGLLYRDEGKGARARPLFKKACAEQIDMACEAWGHEELKRKNVSAARTAFEKGCALKNVNSCHNRGFLAKEAGDPVAIVRYYGQACRMGKYESCPPVERELKRKPDQYAKLLEAYRKECADRQTPALCFRLAEILEEQGKKDEARTFYATACKAGVELACSKKAP